MQQNRGIEQLTDTIHTPDRRLRVFVSSTLEELADERAAVRRAVEALHLTPVLFELGARPHPPRELYLSYLRQSDVFIGIYGERYGWIAPDREISGLEDEYRSAMGMPKLVYLREPAPERDPRLTTLLEQVRDDGLSYRTFHDTAELEGLVADDLAVLVSERFTGDRDDTGAGRDRLPAFPSRFVGRSGVLRDLRDRLADPGVRLLTLRGPGGIGKTRLALELARSLAPSHRDGARVVSLAPVRDREGVVTAIRNELGLSGSYEGSPLDQLRSYLTDRELLLVLDNFEQVAEAAPVVTDLLTAAPRLEVVVTSREVLHLSGEHVFAVPPLELPPADADAETLTANEAVHLFLDRARASRPAAPPGADDLGAVAAIVRRLEGLPLALELAASRTRVLPPAELLARLDRRLGALTGGPRDLPDRQRTLRLTVEWSYDLLDPSQQALFDALGVFLDGFALDSAEAVCGDAAGLDALADLVDRSLVEVEPPSGGAPRFRMLETLRELATEHLEADEREGELRARHAHHFLDLVTDLEAGYEQGAEIALVRRLGDDDENVRAALRWFLTNDRPDLAVRMGRALWRYWWVRSFFREGIAEMEAALEPGDALEDGERAEAHRIVGQLRFGLSEFDEALPHLRRAWRLYEVHRDARGLALTGMPLAVIGAATGEDDWEATIGEALTFADETGDVWARAQIELGYGTVLDAADRHEEAAEVLRRSVEHAASLGTEVLRSYGLVYLGRALLSLDRVDEAGKVLREGLRRSSELDSRDVAGRALEGLAAQALALGEGRLGAVLFGAAEAARRSIAAPVWLVDRPAHDALANGLRAALGDEDFERARSEGVGLDLPAAARLTT